MVFEDAHWADPTTLDVLDLLIDRVKTIPLLVVLTHRPEFQSRWSGQGHVGALNLSKLTRTQSAAMVATLAGGKALPAVLLEQILTRTDGVPLFVEELTKSVLEAGELKDVGDHYDYAGPAHAITIPATLRDSLMARLDRSMPVKEIAQIEAAIGREFSHEVIAAVAPMTLAITMTMLALLTPSPFRRRCGTSLMARLDRSMPVKEIAQIGAAIGREFSHEVIAAVAPMPEAQLNHALARLSESGLAFRRGTPPDAIYTFKHALVQEPRMTRCSRAVDRSCMPRSPA